MEKKIFAAMKIRLADAIHYLSYVPWVGERVVRTAIPMSTQRHKCDLCLTCHEVNLQLVVTEPKHLLTAEGAAKLGVSEPVGFRCRSEGCSGRLGVYLFPGDATNGSKDELVQLVRAVVVAAPGLVPLSKADAERLSGADVYFVE